MRGLTAEAVIPWEGVLMGGDELDLTIKTLGPARFDSPLAVLVGLRQTSLHYVEENDRVLFDDTAAMVAARGAGSSSTRPPSTPASSPAAACAPD